MESFEMEQGDVTEPCNSDYIEVELPAGSENVNIEKLCGNNNGQHLYIHFPNTTDEKSVKIRVTAKRSPQYRIKIHQVSNSIVNINNLFI